MPLLSFFQQYSQGKIFCCLIVVAAIAFCHWKPAEADEDNSPIIRLHGKVILPASVSLGDLNCELVERVDDRLFDFEVTPIELKEDLTFQTQTIGQSNLSTITVRTFDRKWIGTWAYQDHGLLSKSAEEIQLKMVPVKLRALQITFDSKPLSGATVFIGDEYNVEPMKTGTDGIVWFDAHDQKDVIVAAMAQDRLIAIPDRVRLPDDGSSVQLELEQWERKPVQVVGTDGKPIPHVSIACRGIGNEKQTKDPSLQSLYAKSDTDGMTTPVLYSDERLVFDVLSANMRFVSVDRSTKPYRVVVAPVQPNVEVRGKLVLPSEIGEGLLLSGDSFQNEIRNRMSTFKCRVKWDGSFVASVHPEYTYSVFINDATWVSSPWSGIMASTKPDLAKPLSLEIVQGEEVEVLVSRGKDIAPVAGVWVQFAQPHRYSWKDEGKERSGSGGRRWAVQTDSEGIASTRARQGELTTYTYEDNRMEELKATVRPGETTVLNLHRKAPEPVAFDGLVKILDAADSQVTFSQISINVYLYDVNRPTAKLAVDNEGRFHGKAANPRFALVATTEDKQFCGIQVVDLGAGKAEPLVIEVNPTVSIYGRIVDSDGFSFPNVKVQFCLPPVIRSPKNEPFNGTIFHTENRNTTTDKWGKYVFQNVCSRVPFSIDAHNLDNAVWTSYQNTLEPPLPLLPTIFLPEDELNSNPIQTRIKNRANSSRLLNTNAVFVYHGSDKSAADMARGLFGQGAFAVTRDLSPLVVSDATLKSDPANAAWLKEQGWGLSSDQELLLVLFDQTGKAITSKRVQATENITSISEIIDQKQIQLVPHSRNAQSRFDNALDLAKKTDRDIWINFVSIRNPASIALLRWLEEHRQELENHFVLMQIDWIRDEKGEAIMDRYGVTREQAPNLIGVLVNQEGVLLQDTTGESPYKQMWCIDRDRIGTLMKSASKPIDASQLKAWMDSM